MSLETGRQSAPDTLRQQTLFRISLHTLEQGRRDAARSFAATILAGVFLLATPSPTNPESQTGYVSTADNNPITITWGPGSENVDPIKLVGSFVIVGLLVAAGVRELVNADNKESK